MTLLFNAGLPVSGYEFEQHSLHEREAMLQQLFVNTCAVVTRNPAVTWVEIEAEQAIYLVTETGHFAHPSIILRSLVARQGLKTIQVRGFTAAPSEVMSTWVSQFRVQDELVGQTFLRKSLRHRVTVPERLLWVGSGLSPSGRTRPRADVHS